MRIFIPKNITPPPTYSYILSNLSIILAFFNDFGDFFAFM